MYMWVVISTMTKYSEYFVWKDTSERVSRRCEDTVDRKRVNSCILNHLSLDGDEQPKNRQKPPEMPYPPRCKCVFQIFAADAATNKTVRRTVLNTAFCAVSIHTLIRINSGPKCFLHCLWVLVSWDVTKTCTVFLILCCYVYLPACARAPRPSVVLFARVLSFLPLSPSLSSILRSFSSYISSGEIKRTTGRPKIN